MTDWQLPTYAWRATPDGVEMRRFESEAPGPEWVDSPDAAIGSPAPTGIDAMSKEELEAYALDRFGVDVDRRKSRDRLAREIQAMIDDAS